MNVRYRVELSQAERGELTAMLSKGKRAARKLKRAQILLAADAGRSDEEIARAVSVGGSTVYRTKRRFVEGNLERALSEDPRPGAERKLTGKEEALLVATACANPPEVRQPIPAEPGQLERYDCEYRRNGTVNLFVCIDVHRPWRKVKVTERRAAEDYAQCMRELVDVHYPDAACIRVVQDNLSTHSAGALYEAFAPAEARRILRRLEFHYTPKHASWLNMVEIEIGVLRGQCLDRRIDDPKRLISEIAAWEQQRNAAGARIRWMFTTEKARAKMGRAYPVTSKES
jgi:DDE superfamily endonuclease/Winged helix-turn helix